MKFFMSLPHQRLDHECNAHSDDAALEDTIDGAALLQTPQPRPCKLYGRTPNVHLLVSEYENCFADGEKLGLRFERGRSV
jgi:hypothetical protein